jgi:hypothetical protein
MIVDKILDNNGLNKFLKYFCSTEQDLSTTLSTKKTKKWISNQK